MLIRQVTRKVTQSWQLWSLFLCSTSYSCLQKSSSTNLKHLAVFYINGIIYIALVFFNKRFPRGSIDIPLKEIIIQYHELIALRGLASYRISYRLLKNRSLNNKGL